MTNIDTGTYGAKRQSYRKASPRDLLRSLMERNSRAGEKRLHQLFADAARDDPDYIDAIIEYWFANNYRSLVHAEPATPERKAAAVRERTERRAAVAETVKIRAVQMVFLDFVMPTGKPLRDSTGKDCARAGGWLTKVAAAIKPNQKVGEALSEAQVRALFGPGMLGR